MDVVKQEKKRENIGKENLDENVDDPPPAVPVKPAREIGGEDIINIMMYFLRPTFCQYLMNRGQLYEHLKNQMMANVPNGLGRRAGCWLARG